MPAGWATKQAQDRAKILYHRPTTGSMAWQRALDEHAGLNPQEMTEALREKLRLVFAGRSGDTASDEPFLAACAAGFVVAELLALRRRTLISAATAILRAARGVTNPRVYAAAILQTGAALNDLRSRHSLIPSNTSKAEP
jgi:hypothetical protein